MCDYMHLVVFLLANRDTQLGRCMNKSGKNINRILKASFAGYELLCSSACIMANVTINWSDSSFLEASSAADKTSCSLKTNHTHTYTHCICTRSTNVAQISHPGMVYCSPKCTDTTQSMNKKGHNK